MSVGGRQLGVVEKPDDVMDVSFPLHLSLEFVHQTLIVVRGGVNDALKCPSCSCAMVLCAGVGLPACRDVLPCWRVVVVVICRQTAVVQICRLGQFRLG